MNVTRAADGEITVELGMGAAANPVPQEGAQEIKSPEDIGSGWWLVTDDRGCSACASAHEEVQRIAARARPRTGRNRHWRGSLHMPAKHNAGTCFNDAVQMLCAVPPSQRGHVRLVHGCLANLPPMPAGFNHAWLEHIPEQMIYDSSGGKRRGTPAEVFSRQPIPATCSYTVR